MYVDKRIVLATVRFLLAGSLLTVVSSAQRANEPTARDHAVRANEALNAGKPEKAIPEFEALVAIDPSNVDAQANLGVLLYFQKQFGPAAEHLHIAIEHQPDLGKIRGLLGLSEVQLGQRDAAIADLTAALPHVEDVTFRKQIGLTLIELDTAAQRLTDAANIAQNLRDKAPSDPEILYAGYRTATDLAGDSLLSLSLEAPESGQMQQAIAHELLRVRDIAGAIASFRRAAAIDTRLPGIHFELAEALRASPSTADHAQALAEYRTALEQNPLDTQAQVRLADLLADSGSSQEAAALYESALKLNAASVDAAVGLARIESDMGADEKAVPLLEKAAAEDPSNMLAHFRLSNSYRKLHRPEDARRQLAEYQKLKDMKEKLREVYSTMKLKTPGTEDTTTPQGLSH